MSCFDDTIRILELANAEFFATKLFYDSFRQPFPVPRDNCELPIPTPPENWRQFVAFHRQSDECFEAVAFTNWIRWDSVYLGGGMCVKKSFYRNLSKAHWDECRARGGIAQIMLERVHEALDDCVAIFGYCGDKKAGIVDARVGYRPTRHPYIIVKWMAEVSDEKKREIEDRVAAVGPF